MTRPGREPAGRKSLAAGESGSPLAKADWRIHTLLHRFGSSTVSFLSLESGIRYWLVAGGLAGAPSKGSAPEAMPCCVPHADTGGAWVAVGDPLAPADDLVKTAKQFVAAARAEGKRACFFAAESLDDIAFKRVLIGKQPIYRPAAWQTTMKERPRLREQLRRARAKGLKVRRVDASELCNGTQLRREVDRLVADWLNSRPMPPMRFLVSIEPFHSPAGHRYYVAEKDGRAVAFLSAVPIYARRGWFVEDLVRNSNAPNGTAESLIHALMLDTTDDEYVTLGLVPLAGEVLPWLRAIQFLTRPLYSFRGLYAFRERLKPVQWEPVWLVMPRRSSIVVSIIDCLRTFAGGSFVRFGARALLHSPGVPAFALALPLIPWTLLLAALALTHNASILGFSAAALARWILWDACLLLLLISCATKPRRGKLLLVTAAAGLDATSSVLHLAHVGLGPVPVHALLRVICAAAPILGTIALAWAASHRLLRVEP